MNHQVPILQDLTEIFNKNGTYDQEPDLHMKYFHLIFLFFSLHLDKRHARWGVFLSMPAPILYVPAQTHLVSKRFCHESVLP